MERKGQAWDDIGEQLWLESYCEYLRICSSNASWMSNGPHGAAASVSPNKQTELAAASPFWNA